MRLMPGAYCSYTTLHDTKVEFDEDKVTVKYYRYEGNTMPFLNMCKLTAKTANILDLKNNFIATGLFGGLLSGSCGYYVVLHNENQQTSTKITIYRNAEDFNSVKALSLTASFMSLIGVIMFADF